MNSSGPREKGYHSRKHDEDPTCHKTHEGDTPCEPVEPKDNQKATSQTVVCPQHKPWHEGEDVKVVDDGGECADCQRNNEMRWTR